MHYLKSREKFHISRVLDSRSKNACFLQGPAFLCFEFFLWFYFTFFYFIIPNVIEQNQDKKKLKKHKAFTFCFLLCLPLPLQVYFLFFINFDFEIYYISFPFWILLFGDFKGNFFGSNFILFEFSRIQLEWLQTFYIYILSKVQSIKMAENQWFISRLIKFDYPKTSPPPPLP